MVVLIYQIIRLNEPQKYIKSPLVAFYHSFQDSNLAMKYQNVFVVYDPRRLIADPSWQLISLNWSFLCYPWHGFKDLHNYIAKYFVCQMYWWCILSKFSLSNFCVLIIVFCFEYIYM